MSATNHFVLKHYFAVSSSTNWHLEGAPDGAISGENTCVTTKVFGFKSDSDNSLELAVRVYFCDKANLCHVKDVVYIIPLHFVEATVDQCNVSIEYVLK